MSSKFLSGAFCIAALTTVTLQGASITNGDFEAANTAAGGATGGAPLSWTLVGSDGEVFTLGEDFSGNGTDIATFWSASGISQTIGENVTANTQIQVQFDIGRRDDQPDAPTGFTAGLYTSDDNTTLAQITLVDEPNVFDTQGGMSTVSFTFNPGASPAKAGSGILLRFLAPAADNNLRQIALDNVSVSVVPEPTTYALLSGLGLVGMAAYRRHKLRKA